ncbi:unnamed protein product [Auanema sp. JU1783]|nr:unnamed protein product [Auanema sp. JU1783]
MATVTTRFSIEFFDFFDKTMAEYEQHARSKVRLEVASYDQMNGLLHSLLNRRQYEDCKVLIKDSISKFNELCEYSLYVAGLIERIEGNMENSLSYFEKAYKISNNDPRYLREIGRVNYLSGQHRSAIENLEKAVKYDKFDGMAYYWLAKSICRLETDLFKPLEKARDLICQVPNLLEYPELLELLGDVQTELGEYATALQAHTRALETVPEDESIMLKIGLLNMRLGLGDPAFSVFGRALTYTPSNADCILAIGSIMQNHGDHDVALSKYRIAARTCDYNGFLWNNIGICLFAKGKLAAAHSCLKRASYLSPLNYQILFNLGVIHLTMDLNASARYYLKAAVELNKGNSSLIGAYAVSLANIKDNRNAKRAYIHALGIESHPRTLLNFAIFSYRNNEKEISMEMLQTLKSRLPKLNRERFLHIISSFEDLLKKSY